MTKSEKDIGAAYLAEREKRNREQTKGRSDEVDRLKSDEVAARGQQALDDWAKAAFAGIIAKHTGPLDESGMQEILKKAYEMAHFAMAYKP